MPHWMVSRRGPDGTHDDDAVLARADIGLYGVADGMGGAGVAELASAMALSQLADKVHGSLELVDRLADYDDREGRQGATDFLMEAVRETNQMLHQAKQQRPEHGRMGTTLCAALVRGRQALIVNVGDSRAYLLRGGRLHLLTEDHTLVQEQLRRGMLTQAQAAKSPYRNILIRSMGSEALVDPDIVPVELKVGDRLLLCTDGVSDRLDEQALAELMAGSDGDEAVSRMVERAHELGGRDSASAVLVEIDASSAARSTSPPSPFEVDPDDKVRVLWQLPIFHHLEYAELVKLMAVTSTRFYGPGETVLREHEPGGTFLVIIEGSMTVERSGQVLTELAAGEQVGELALLDGSPRSATVLAKERCAALSITSSDFYDLVRREPVMATKLLWRIGVQMARRIRDLTAEVARRRSDDAS